MRKVFNEFEHFYILYKDISKYISVIYHHQTAC